jgi:two-component system OmpR family response regulator/two-component system response regulator QseB
MPSQAQLAERLYGWNEAAASHAVDVYLHHLRQTLEPALMRTVRGLGSMELTIL